MGFLENGNAAIYFFPIFLILFLIMRFSSKHVLSGYIQILGILTLLGLTMVIIWGAYCYFPNFSDTQACIRDIPPTFIGVIALILWVISFIMTRSAFKVNKNENNPINTS